MRDRSAFGYMEPSPDIPDFAQCGSCLLLIKSRKRCFWLSDDKEVDADDSCIMYVQGEPMEGPVTATGSLTPEEVGFTDGKVRCENCNAFRKENTGCGLFHELTQLLPRVFRLDNKVKPKACCNAFERGSYDAKAFGVSRIMNAIKAA